MSSHRANEKKRHALSRVYRLLEPGPVVLLTTSGPERPNVMTLSWHTMLDFEPPLIGCVISPANYSHGLLTAARSCVINIPTDRLAHQVVACGNTSGRRIDKFSAFGLTARPSSIVDPPSIAECYASIECRLVDARSARRYEFFVLEALAAWVEPSAAPARTLHHRGNGRFMVGGREIRLPSRKK